ncbi:MAG TPA: SH3 domain-containing protein [Thermodesulfobacteriota bacterium]|nr:SH3 domain-containing protein [Thermodesulfobacteriota bacterium]
MNSLTRVLFSITLVIVFSCLPLGSVPEVIGNSHPLPHVSPKMEKPEFWINKVHNPTFQLLKPEQIQELNDENLRRPDFYLCQVKDLKEEWSREELIELLNEDWQGFGETSEVRFGRNGNPLKGSFWRELKENISEDRIKTRNQLSFGLIVKRADIRVFPTEEPSLSSPAHSEFDRFQHSMISPGTLVGIYHFSKDLRWLYLQTPFIRGWVERDAVAIGIEKKTAIQYEEAKERLVVTGSYVTLFSDSSLQKEPLVAQMGASFPLTRLPQSNGSDGQYYIVKVPYREKEGQLAFRNGYISKGEDAHPGFLPYTQANVARQAFKMLHQPYGWGEMARGRDCSRFIMDIFATCGILMPRNSKFQAQVGINPGPIEGKTSQEKRRVLEQATPFATTLRLPGHIMLYLGKDKGRHYVIHSIWGFQKKGKSGPTLERVGGVVVSDLSLGGNGPNGSLLERLTDIRFIGEETDSKKQ